MNKKLCPHLTLIFLKKGYNQLTGRNMFIFLLSRSFESKTVKHCKKATSRNYLNFLRNKNTQIQKKYFNADYIYINGIMFFDLAL